MNKLDPKEIVRNAIDGLTYSKAYDLFSSKKVTLSCHRNELDQDVYEGVVTGKSNKSYPVTAIIDKDGKVVEATCKCDYYLTYPGYCKHILAFLLQINELTNKKETNVLSTMLQYYKKNVTLNINITPIFYSYKYETGLEFKIGKGQKKYYIKNIPELYDNIANNYYFKYGKDLEFMHTMSAFDPVSRTIIEDVNDYINFYGQDSKNYFDGKRRLKVPKIVFKKILDLFEGQEIEFVFDEAHFELVYTNEAPDIELVYANETLSIKDRNHIKMFSIGRYHFVIKNGKLHCIDGVLPTDLIPLLNTLYIRPIEFNTKLYNEFFTYIYPKVNNLITINGLDEFLKHNNCSTLDAECYLDLNESQLFLTYKFKYEGMDRDEAINKGIFPNTAMEENFSEQLQYFNFIKTTNKNEYYLDSFDDSIEFILSGVENLKEIATVYVSDSIKHLKPVKTSGNPVGIRYSNNWLELIFNEQFFNVNELAEILDSIKKKKKYHLLSDGTVLNIQEKFFGDLADVADSINLNSNSIKQYLNIPVYKVLQLERFFDQKAIPSEAIKFLHDIRNYQNINYPIDKELSPILRDYQKEGDRWLFNLAYYRLSGILADDMGLGKTLEIITLLKSCKTKYPNLIVTPASLTFNWFNEFKKWAPKLNVVLVNGNSQAREKTLASVEPGQILITSYDYLKRDLEIYQKMSFHFMIIDEAQAIKNFQTKNAEAVKSVKAISRFAMTGTPIENSLADLWSIFDFCLPNYLKSYDSFKNEYEIEIVRNHNSQVLERLNHQIAPFILRRTKAEVLRELPEKFEQVIYAPLSEAQEQIYNATLLQAREKIISTNAENKMYIFSMLTRLRQICCHPKLYVDNYEGDSAKMELVNEIVYETINSNHRVLIFSQFTSMLDLLDKSLDEKHILHYKLTGSTPVDERMRLVDEFNDNTEIKVFLISLKAGGMGLNLTGADTVIHYDPWWNMSAENQASDRVHRIGQKNNVHIIKIITKDSIEEKILELQSKKKELFEKVVNEDSSVLSKLSNDELLSLFNIDASTLKTK